MKRTLNVVALTGIVAGMLLCARGKASMPGRWVPISGGVLQDLQQRGIKPGWPGKTTGVAVDPATGDVYMVVTGVGVWQSADGGRTFKRVDNETVGGRCETGYSLCVDPAGKRLACFMLDGPSGMTEDGGKTWAPIRNVARGFDWAAVDWAQRPARTMFGLVHESGGLAALSQDGGKSWKELGKGYLAVGVFSANVLVCGKEKEGGIYRSEDGGTNWHKVHEARPIGAMRLFGGKGYWLTDKGLLVSRDRGTTWTRIGDATGAAWGPYFGADAKHFVVVDAKGYHETRDAGTTWRTIAPLPPPFTKEFNPRGWFLNVAWDPIGKACYASRMGQATYRYTY